jgi:hypothetical protein
MPLNACEIKILADFARFVDRENIARTRIRNALTLDEVVLVAHFYGFREISIELFIKATSLLISTDWIWKKYGRRWSDHVFMLSLMMLTQDKISEPEEVQLLDTNEFRSEVVNADNEAKAFYEYAKLTKDLQIELRQSQTIDEVVYAARSHGFLIRKVDFLMNKHEWQDDFFPWGNMSTHETRGFMHGSPPPRNGCRNIDKQLTIHARNSELKFGIVFGKVRPTEAQANFYWLRYAHHQRCHQVGR